MSDPERNDLVVLSRRALIGVASAAPLYGIRNSAASPDDVASRCKEWLALEDEIDRLSRRWARLEARMVRDLNWFALSLEQRRSVPKAQEIFEIEGRLDHLSDERERGLEALANLKARDLRGVAGKLAVAARALHSQGGPLQQLVAGALRELADKAM